jgi:hypothetical protein
MFKFLLWSLVAPRRTIVKTKVMGQTREAMNLKTSCFPVGWLPWKDIPVD